MQLNTDKRTFTNLFLLSAILISGGLLFYTLRFFIDAFLGAVIFYVLFRKTFRFLSQRKRWKPGLAALLIILISFLIVLIPTFLAVYLIVPRITLFFSSGSITMSAINELDSKIKSATGIQLLSQANIESVQAHATDFIANFFGQSLGVLTSIVLMYFVLYYMLVYTGRMESTIFQYLPFKESTIKKFTDELESQTFSNAIGAPLLALVQGLFAALGYWIFGIDEPLFWGIMTGFFSFVPVVGSAIIWIPAGIYQYTAGFHYQGIAIILYGIFVIALMDNVLRFTFQKRFADVHPLITVVGVISGIELFGVPGIIFGPLLISYFLLLMKIFKEEYLDSSTRE